MILPQVASLLGGLGLGARLTPSRHAATENGRRGSWRTQRTARAARSSRARCRWRRAPHPVSLLRRGGGRGEREEQPPSTTVASSLSLSLSRLRDAAPRTSIRISSIVKRTILGDLTVAVKPRGVPSAGVVGESGGGDRCFWLCSARAEESACLSLSGESETHWRECRRGRGCATRGEARRFGGLAAPADRLIDAAWRRRSADRRRRRRRRRR